MSDDSSIVCTVGCDYQSYYDTHQTNFTCNELIDFCAMNEWLKWKQVTADVAIAIGLMTAGCVALITYIVTLMVFRLPDFTGPSYIYHKSLVGMELVHMMVLAQQNFAHLLPLTTPTYVFAFYCHQLRQMWTLGDWMKLSTSMLTAFLSLERLVAVLCPNKFHVINTYKVASCFLILSVFAGFLHMGPAFFRTLDLDGSANATGLDFHGVWISEEENSRALRGGIGGEEHLTTMIYFAKVTSAVATIVFSTGVAAGLIVSSRKVSKMTPDGKKRWKDTRRLSILQLVTALLQVVDHAVWIVFNIIFDRQPVKLLTEVESITQVVYTEAVDVVKHLEILLYASIFQQVTGAFDHCTRFPLYILGLKSFRRELLAMFSKGDR